MKKFLGGGGGGAREGGLAVYQEMLPTWLAR